MLVAFAGPAFNLAVVGLAGVGYRNVTDPRLLQVIGLIALVNTYLFIINILPIPPLDGSKVLARFLSPAAAVKMQEWGQYLLLFLLVLFLVFHGVIENIARSIYEPILGIRRGF
jgi:Zn-dependent protease